MAWVVAGAASLLAAPAWGRDCRPSYTRLLEKRLTVALEGMTSPLKHPAGVRPEAVARADASAVHGLDALKVSYREAESPPIPTALAHYVGRGEITPEGGGPLGHSGKLFEVTGITPVERSLALYALHHPDTPALLEKLREMGVRVYVDPTFRLTGAGGLHWTEHKAIAIPVTASYETLVHEVAHAEFRHHRIGELADKVREYRRQGKDVRELIRDPAHAGFGRARLRRVIALVDRGYPTNSLNETLAVEAELGALRRQGYWTWRSGRGHHLSYAARHRLNDLANLARERELTPEERRLLSRTLGELGMPGQLLRAKGIAPSTVARLYRWAVTPLDRTVATAAWAVPAGAAVAAVAFHEALGRLVIWLTDGTVLQWDEDGEREPRSGTSSERNRKK